MCQSPFTFRRDRNYFSGSDEFLEQLFHSLLDFGNRVVGRSKSSHRHALLVDNELSEVPFDGTAKPNKVCVC